MSGEPVQETNSGVKKKGSWKEIARFGEKVRDAIKDSAGNKSIKRFEEWRPKEKEAENDMKQKTVEEAVIEENEIEEQSNGAASDLKDAGKNVARAGKKVTRREKPEKELVEASEDVAKPFYTKVAEAFRSFENLVYSKIFMRFDRYYLDTEDLSVDMKSRDGEYEMDVNIPENEMREDLKKRFEEE